MKKMMMIAAVALLAIGAQAGAISWSTLSLKTADVNNAFTTTNLGSTGNPGIALLFLGDSTAQAATAAALANGTFTSAGAVASAVFGTKGTASGLYGSYTSGAISAYIVVFDDSAVPAADGSKNYMISTVITKTFTATGNQTYAFGTVAGTWTDYGVVPEPASAALLAVGAAVFGLRRKFRK